MWKLLRFAVAIPVSIVGFIISAFAGDICSRIIAPLIDVFMGWIYPIDSVVGASDSGKMDKEILKVAIKEALLEMNKETKENTDKEQNFKSNKGGQMFIARSLDIAHSKNNNYWIWKHQKESRFVEVAELLQVWWMDIIARIKLDKLFPKTNYSAHLIFKTTASSRGLDTLQEASVSMGSLHNRKAVCIKPKAAGSCHKCIELPVKRSDGWMELELGQFYCDNSTARDREVVVRLKETDDYNRKTGLIVAGIEVRPIYLNVHACSCNFRPY